MAEKDAMETQYLDIHKDDQEELGLGVEEYLSKDLIRNWCSAWRSSTVQQEFIEFSGSAEARKRLWYNGYVTICGYPGDGKTSLADNLGRYFSEEPLLYPKPSRNSRQEGNRDSLARNEFLKLYIDDADRKCYNTVYVSSPEEYKRRVHKDSYELVIIDDIFGEAMLEWRKIEAWRPYLEELLWSIMTQATKTLVVICVNKAHLQRAPSDVTQLEWFKPGTMVDLTTKGMLDDDFIMKMANITSLELNHQPQRGFSEVESAKLLYKIRRLVSKFAMAGEEFYRNPWDRILAEIYQIYKVDVILYYTLAIAVLLEGKLNLDKRLLADYEGRTRSVMEQLITILGVPLDVSQSKLRFAAKLLSGFFFRSVGKHQWEITHSRIYSLCLTSLLKHNSKIIVELLSVDTISKYIGVGVDFKEYRNEMVVICPKEQYESLARKMLVCIVMSSIDKLVPSECFQDEEFVTVFYNLAKGMGCVGQVVYTKDAEYGRSFFYWACHYGHGHLIKLILSETNDVNIKSDARFKEEFILGYLAACASPSKTSCLVVQPLQEETEIQIPKIVRKDNISNVSEFLGHDFRYLLSMEAPILHIACLKGNHATVEYMIQQGADIEEQSKDGMRAIHRAAGRLDKEGANVVQSLLQNRANIEARTDRQFTALDIAVKSGNADSVRHLIIAGADVNRLQGDNQNSYMCRAVQRQDLDIVRTLSIRNVNVNGSPGNDMFPPLCQAAQSGNTAIVNKLKLGNDLDENTAGCNGWTALHVACYLGNQAMVKELLTDKTDVNCKDKDGNTPLHLAAGKGVFDICELLLRAGARPEMMNNKRESPLVCAARANHAMVTWLLMKEGMNLDPVK